MFSERALAYLLGASLATLIGALGFQYIVGLDPCVLCIYQRWPYVAVAAICVVALFAKTLARPALFACGVIFLASAALAAYHIGVEQGWVAGTAACGAAGGATTVDQLRAQIMNAPATRCDEVAWSLFGISLAGYNLLISVALATFSWVAGVNLRRQSMGRGSRFG